MVTGKGRNSTVQPTAKSAPTTNPTVTGGGGQCDDLEAWSPTTPYTRGQTVSYGGHKWTAREWNQNSVPGGAAGVWRDNGSCGGGGSGIAAWSPTIAYTRGQAVTYAGHKWTAREWNQNSVPGGAAGVWIDNGPYGGGADIAPWSPTIAYTRGQTVTYAGKSPLLCPQD
ncbi:hypothetical protein FRC10_011659 [Ceratobasidium sp. 414]|nr:hypothetical protein FRC10_011659 [Ceratobasidium sp. 414]